MSVFAHWRASVRPLISSQHQRSVAALPVVEMIGAYSRTDVDEPVVAGFAEEFINGPVVVDGRCVEEIIAVKAAGLRAVQVSDASGQCDVGSTPLVSKRGKGRQVRVMVCGAADQDVIVAAAAERVDPQPSD